MALYNYLNEPINGFFLMNFFIEQNELFLVIFYRNFSSSPKFVENLHGNVPVLNMFQFEPQNNLR